MYHYSLCLSAEDRKKIAKEREKAKKLKKSNWWQIHISRGVCHYCRGQFSPKLLTMDHIVPLARGGSSQRGNIVPACQACNQAKKLDTPVDQLLS